MKRSTLLFILLALQFVILTGISALCFSNDSGLKDSKNTVLAKGMDWLHHSKNQINFLENKGQVLNESGSKATYVNFVLERGESRVFLLDNAIAWQFQRMHYPDGIEQWNDKRFESAEEWQQYQDKINEVRLETFRMDIELVGANPLVEMTAHGKSDDYLHYYQHDALNVHHFERVIYHNVYPNIDWVIYTTKEGVKYDFIVKPEGDASSIKLQMKHQDEVHVDKQGRLNQTSAMGNIIEQKPKSFQNGKEIETEFVLKKDVVSFEIGEYDSTQILTIDPERIWGTYYGGTGLDRGFGCATDSDNNVYLTGYSFSSTPSTIIASGGHQNIMGGVGSGVFITAGDAFLVKFSPGGERIWGTFYGGIGQDEGLVCTTDNFGNVYMAGKTYSETNIAWNGHLNTNIGELYYIKSFLVKFNAYGVRQWGTYYGGPNESYGQSCSADQNGNVYLAGNTFSETHVAYQGHQDSYSGNSDSYLVKFNANGVRQWATYYGGSGSENRGFCVVDQQNDVYLVGGTTSSQSIAFQGYQNEMNGSSDGFIAKFDSDGNRVWATYFGGESGDSFASGAVDTDNNLLVAGSTGSSEGIFLNGYQEELNGSNDALLAKFDTDGNRLWSTYFGGNINEYRPNVATDTENNVYLAGYTNSFSGLAFNGFQNSTGGTYDAYLAKFSAEGEGLWATYFGDTGWEWSYGCATDNENNVYLAGRTASENNIAENGHQDIHGGSDDAFLVKFSSEITSNLEEHESSINAFSIFPNPASDYTILNTLPALVGSEYHIYNLLGKEVYSGTILGEYTIIELSPMSNGIYLLTVADSAISKKLIKR